MILDILLNSCARPDLLEQSVYSTRENIVSDKHTFRWVIVEDLVADPHRRNLGRQWIEDHSDLFDEIVFSDTPAVMDKFWQKVLVLCRSPIHVKAEDDTKYIKKINIDPLVDFLINHNDVLSVVFCRGKINPSNYLEEVVIDNIKLTKFRMVANSVGVFNTKLLNNLIDYIGWDKVLSESKVLTPACDKLGYKKYVLGQDDQHYIHAGAAKKYRKGNWKNG